MENKNNPTALKLSPAMERYVEIKNEYPDYLIFYRMGDFYELFFEDAEIASNALDITLTSRGKSGGKSIPMCGVPFHAYENYMARLIRQGYKVAICEQVETPAEAKKRGSGAVLKREVVRLVTSGTLTEDNLLNARKNNYLLCCVLNNENFGISWLDLSTCEFYTQFVPSCKNNLATDLLSILTRLDPSEILISDAVLKMPDLFQALNFYRTRLTSLAQTRFNSENMEKILKDTYKVNSLDAFGNFSKHEITAAGLIIDYVLTTQKGKLPELKYPIKYNDSQFMEIDGATRHNLELCASVHGDRKISLLNTIDHTITGGGARMLASRMNNPSTNINEINQRLDMIGFFIEIPEIRDELRLILKQSTDLERCLSRLSLGKSGPRDIYGLAQTLMFIPKIRNLLFGYGRYKQLINGLPQALEKMLNSFGEFSALTTKINEALLDYESLPVLYRDGGFIRVGYSAALDALRSSRSDGHEIIKQMEAKYIKETGITNLKVRYNSVLGYFVEVPTKFATDLIQNPTFIHRQSILTAARFTTIELNEIEQKTSNAAERAVALEIELYNSLIKDIIAYAEDIRHAATIFSELDVSSALAELAVTENYCRPIVDNSLDFEIKGGRHPVVETALKNENGTTFVCNDCHFDAQHNRIWLLTGPNMAGKSTFLRQNAIIALMAQMGSYVPCSYAKIGIVDKLFSRVGASDDLSRGRSTFMVEMVETAAILNQATERSFVILDEIGRGTATYDGLSLAWAVVEHLHEINKCRSLFATHYHELTILASKLNALSLHCIRIKEYKNNVIFLHEVIDGATERSYGIHVARLAGLPKIVTRRADQILHSLEQSPNNQVIASIENDLPLFSAFKIKHEQENKPSPLSEALKQLKPDELSPREALDKLYELKKLADDAEKDL